MSKADGTLEKLLTIEKAVNEMVTLRQGILELKESEAQRQKALEDLREVENRYETLLRNMAPKLFMKDKNSVYILCNPSYAADRKLRPEQISGKTDYDLYPAELAEKYVADDQRIIHEGRPENFEETFVGEGQSLILNTVKTPVKDENGEIIGILGISWDISEQKRKEEELEKKCQELEDSVSALTADLQWKSKLMEREIAVRRETEERLKGAEGLRGLFEQMGVPAVLIEDNLLLTLANKEFENLSGYTKEEVEGKKLWTEFFTRPEAEKITGAWGTRGENPNPLIPEKECQFLDKKGNLRDVSLSLSWIPGTRRRVASLMDITDYKRSEERVQEIEEMFDCLVENAAEGIVIVQEGMVRFVNPKIIEILGYKHDEVISQPFEGFILPEDREQAEICGEKSASREPGRSCSFRMMGKDGRVRWLERKGVVMEWEKKPAMLNLLTDITYRKLAEEELRLSITPFQTLVAAMDKYFLALNGNTLKSQGVDLRGSGEDLRIFFPASHS
jgi:PAS domain S-box-containing protein